MDISEHSQIFNGFHSGYAGIALFCEPKTEGPIAFLLIYVPTKLFCHIRVLGKLCLKGIKQPADTPVHL